MDWTLRTITIRWAMCIGMAFGLGLAVRESVAQQGQWRATADDKPAAPPVEYRIYESPLNPISSAGNEESNGTAPLVNSTDDDSMWSSNGHPFVPRTSGSPSNETEAGEAAWLSQPPAIERAAQWQGEPQNQILNQEPEPFIGVPATPPESAVGAASLPDCTPPPPRLPWIIPVATRGSVTWLPGDGDTLGMVDLEAQQTFLLPRTKGWMVSPAFSAHLLNGPTSTDLPPTLYGASVDIMWMKDLSPRWKLQLAVAPGIYSDFQNTGSNAYRTTGRAIATWQMDKTWQFAFGVVYLDRDDIAALPALGLVYTPSDDFKVEAIFPRPRVAWRTYFAEGDERWFYLAGELGGGSWAVVRESGADDTLTYSALRLLAGYEIKRKGRFSPRFEAGYVFNRQIEYESNIGNFDPSAAAMIRFGGSF
jgi:hypothetical protein